jgi:hypothetical protein
MRHFLQFNDLSAAECAYVFERAALIKKKFKAYPIGYFRRFAQSLRDHSFDLPVRPWMSRAFLAKIESPETL